MSEKGPQAPPDYGAHVIGSIKCTHFNMVSKRLEDYGSTQTRTEGNTWCRDCGEAFPFYTSPLGFGVLAMTIGKEYHWSCEHVWSVTAPMGEKVYCTKCRIQPPYNGFWGTKYDQVGARLSEKLLETVDHPQHYGGADNVYEAIKVIEDWKLGFCLGNCVKYISRAGKKGDALEDLKKARWYLDREIQNIESVR